jgi:translation initiation factor IF-2
MRAMSIIDEKQVTAVKSVTAALQAEAVVNRLSIALRGSPIRDCNSPTGALNSQKGEQVRSLNGWQGSL